MMMMPPLRNMRKLLTLMKVSKLLILEQPSGDGWEIQSKTGPALTLKLGKWLTSWNPS